MSGVFLESWTSTGSFVITLNSFIIVGHNNILEPMHMMRIDVEHVYFQPLLNF